MIGWGAGFAAILVGAAMVRGLGVIERVVGGWD
jgi:hypothetical protein